MQNSGKLKILVAKVMAAKTMPRKFTIMERAFLKAIKQP